MVAAAVIGGAVIGGVSSNMAAGSAADASQKATDQTVREQQRQFDLVRGDTAKLRGLGDSAIGAINKLYGYGGASAAPLTFEQWSAQQQHPNIGGNPLGGGGRWGEMIGRDMTVPGKPSGNLQQQYQQYLSAQPHNTGKPDLSGFFASPDYQFRLGEGNKAIENSAAARGGLLSGAAVKAGARYSSGLASQEYGAFYDRLAQQAGLGVTGIGASAAAGSNAANNIGNAYMQNGMNRGSAYMQGAQGVNNAVQGGISNYLFSGYLNQPGGGYVAGGMAGG